MPRANGRTGGVAARVGLLAGAALTLAAASGCRKAAIELHGRPCQAGRCVPGYACHPETNLCVPETLFDCAAEVASCPSMVTAGDPCDNVGSFAPCTDDVADCSAGCRTCLESHQWGYCTDPVCELAQVYSCASCDEDCRALVRHATLVSCETTGAVPHCSYRGACHPGWGDANLDRRDGCECRLVEGAAEVCDLVDNDCDGLVDEGFAVGVTCGLGPCAGGASECRTDHIDVICSTGPGGSNDQSGIEICDNLDNDCDSQIDEDFPAPCVCVTDAVQQCDAGWGVESGSQTCTAERQWGQCRLLWRQRVRLDLDNTGLSEAVTHFPLLVRLDGTEVDYADLGPGGSAMRFVASDAVSLLPHAIEHWQPTGTSLVWVRVAEIPAPPAEAFIWLYFDHPSPPSPPAGSVWEGQFQAVWHLDEDAVGVGTTATYRDDSGHGHHGADQVTAALGVGMIGAGLAPAPGDQVVVPTAAALVPATLSLSLWAEAFGAGWQRVADLALTPATPVAGYQVPVVLTPTTFLYARAKAGGADLRFYDPAGASLPYWVEWWDDQGTSLVWVRVATAGTAGLRLYFDNPAATSESNAAAVLDANTLWLTQWNHARNIPTTNAAMETHFQGLAYAARTGWGPSAPINCVTSDCNLFGVDDDYSTLFEGWISITTAAIHDFATDSDDASDLILGGTAWKNNTGGTIVATRYRATGLSSNWDDAGSISLGVGLHRFQYRQIEGGGSDAYRAAFRIAPNAFAIIPAARFFCRKRHATTPVPSLSPSRPVGATVIKEGSYGLSASGATAVVSLNDQSMVLSLTAGWHHLGMTYDGATWLAYVDGAPAAPTDYAVSVSPSSGPLRLGDWADDLLRQGGRLDEVRLSAAVLPGGYFALATMCEGAGCVSWGTPEGT